MKKGPMEHQAVARVRELLREAGYRWRFSWSTDSVRSDANGGDIEGYTGPGPVILVQHVPEKKGLPGSGGFEVFAPVSDSLSISETLRALTERIGAER